MDVFSVFDAFAVPGSGLGSPTGGPTAPGGPDPTAATTGLTVPDPPDAADPQMAAGFHLGPVVVLSVPGVAAGSPSVAGPAGVVPLPSASGQWSVVSGQWTADGGPTGSQLGPESTLVIQAMNPEDRRGRVIGMHSEATDLALTFDLLDPTGKPSARPMADPRIGREPRAIPDRTDRTEGPAAIPIGRRAGRAIDSVLDDLAADAGPVRGRRAEWFGVPVLAGDGAGDAPVAVELVRLDRPALRSESPRKAASWPSQLAAILLAVGSWSYRARFRGVTGQRAGRPRSR